MDLKNMILYLIKFKEILGRDPKTKEQPTIFVSSASTNLEVLKVIYINS